jgi:hypothetical protein
MSTKLIVFAAALIAAGPVLAASGTSSAGSSNAGSSSSSPAHSGSGSGGGGHVGESGGGGGRSAASGLGGRGAALASHGNGIHANALHATNSIAGNHASEQSTAKIAGMDHHHHLFRLEPRYRENPLPRYFEFCVRAPDDPFRPWLCNGATKNFTGTKRQS